MTDSELDTKAIRLTKGYSRDHRPDLNQVILNLITENNAGIPVYMQACSGNINDSEGFKKIVKSHVSSLKQHKEADTSLQMQPCMWLRQYKPSGTGVTFYYTCPTKAC